MDSIPKFLATVVAIMIGVLLCVSLIISAVVVNSARTYHSSVIKQVEASDFEEVTIQKCIMTAESDNYDLAIEKIQPEDANSTVGFYKVTLRYGLSAPLFGKIHNGTLVGYALSGAHVGGGLGSGDDESAVIAPGLYRTGSDYRVLLKSWDELISEGVVSVTDGVVSTGFTSGNNASSDALAGDLMLPFDNSVTEVGDLAFFKCTKLTGVKIPDNVKTIGRQAFDGCSVLTTVELGNGIEFIDYNVFGYDPIQNVIYNGTTEDWCKITFDSPWSNPAYKRNGAILYLKEEPLANICYLTVPSTVTSLENKFIGYGSLLEVVIPDDSQLKTIDDHAFKYCSNLRRVSVGSSVEKIGQSAFLDSALELIMIPESVVEIDSKAFYYCDYLTDIYYYGTLDQWLAISFGSDWDAYTPSYTVHFADGSSMTKTAIEAERQARAEG